MSSTLTKAERLIESDAEAEKRWKEVAEKALLDIALRDANGGPTPTDAAELASLLVDLKYTPERYVDLLNAIERAANLQGVATVCRENSDKQGEKRFAILEQIFVLTKQIEELNRDKRTLASQSSKAMQVQRSLSRLQELHPLLFESECTLRPEITALAEKSAERMRAAQKADAEARQEQLKAAHKGWRIRNGLDADPPTPTTPPTTPIGANQ
ncbi:MAG: hypothetical protein AAFX06_33145 [Planctomycetota bacterium]